MEGWGWNEMYYSSGGGEWAVVSSEWTFFGVLGLG